MDPLLISGGWIVHEQRFESLKASCLLIVRSPWPHGLLDWIYAWSVHPENHYPAVEGKNPDSRHLGGRTPRKKAGRGPKRLVFGPVRRSPSPDLP